MEVIKKEYIKNYSKTVYDLKIKDNHNYKITKSDLIVHNSGKGFVLGNVLLFKGKTFDTDEVKKKILKFKDKKDSKIWKEFEQYAIEQNYPKTDLEDLDLTNSDDTSILHLFTKQRGYYEKFKDLFFSVVANNKNKPNVIFDVTLKDVSALDNIKSYLDTGNYEPKNVHLVWIVNSFDIALKQNAQRDRRVSFDIMLTTHNGAALSMKEIITNAEKYRNIIDGDIWIVPNKVGVDSSSIDNTEPEVDWKGKKYKKAVDLEKMKATTTIAKYTAIPIKKSGNPAMKFEEIQKDILDKIREYIPEITAKNF